LAGGGAGVAVDGVVDELLVPAETGREVSHCCGSVVWHFDRVDDGSGRQQDPDGPLDFVEVVTVDDPVVLTRPFTVAYPMWRDDEYRLYEYACHEGNTAIRYYIETSRYERGLTR